MAIVLHDVSLDAWEAMPALDIVLDLKLQSITVLE